MAILTFRNWRRMSGSLIKSTSVTSFNAAMKARLTNHVGSLPAAKLRALREALRLALGVE